ncbi:MAG: ATP-binding cassette domain-containing protein, partial [Frankiaceae bacterium]|nr:ATP-binding cassette domain-containing protein [Frankiaceae bacterium]
MTASDVVVARGASARRGGRVVWSQVDVTVRAGEFVAILGPNGVGKSTFLQVLLGLLPPASGEVRVLGAAPGEANRRIGYLPQRHAFAAGTRVRGVDVVRLGWDGDRWGIPLPFGLGGAKANAARERVDEVVELVGASAYA